MVRPVSPLVAAAVLALTTLVGCGGADEPEPKAPARAPPTGEVAVPDGGTVAGHDTRRVRVPERDPTPPLAQLRLQPGGGAPPVVHSSPVRTGSDAPAVMLARPEVRATALIRDADGGTGRIRLTVHWVQDCGGERRLGTVNLPPAQIERIRIAPGVRAPVERRRTALVRLPRRCRVTGEAFADATNASGLESFSDPVRFAHQP